MKIDLLKVPDDKSLNTSFQLILPVLQTNSQLFKRLTESSFKLGKIKIRILQGQLIITFAPNKVIKVPLRSISSINIAGNILLIDNIVGIQF